MSGWRGGGHVVEVRAAKKSAEEATMRSLRASQRVRTSGSASLMAAGIRFQRSLMLGLHGVSKGERGWRHRSLRDARAMSWAL
jgi:hypothetical protein